jgi:hypothetical protein
MVNQNIKVSSVVVSDILDWDHLYIAFQVLDHVKTGNLAESVAKFTDRKWFRSLASELLSIRIEIDSEVEAGKAARNFTASYCFGVYVVEE